MKQLDLRGQVALVTGGAGAMGGALGHVLEQAGAPVAAAVAAGMAGDRASGSRPSARAQ